MRNSDMLDRTGMAGDNIKVPGRSARTPKSLSRAAWGLIAAVAIVVAATAIVLAPSGETGAVPGRTGGNCGNCHPLTTTSFLTVTGFPTEYVPGQVYTITVTVADTNGATGENSFDLILAAGGGTVVGVDQYVKNVSALQVATQPTTGGAALAQWTVKWTAPTTGDVTVDTWAVFGTGAGSGSPYEHITTTVTASAIPEFSLLLVPILGIAAALVLIVRVRKGKRT